MNRRVVFGAMVLACLLSGCSGAPPHPQPEAAPGPRGFVASAPPADSSFTPLRCVPNGPGFDCTRKP